ncbi:uncharacterized protein LOC119672930 [Teleopsis dalmanni]|uniref:uncharacterized protein LOC119672930 n=1 Tax=Teleopsis dalmanni TaxID=139649 RepID=UPI0018CFE153|nr:uncharacterized protein LOC119672930 [Teleopsis dalmanni]
MSVQKRKTVIKEKLSDETLDKFIDARISLHEMFIEYRFRPRKCWELVGEQSGIHEPWITLRNRWYMLIDRYRRFKKLPTDGRRYWPLYEKIHGYYSQRNNINLNLNLPVIKSKQNNPVSLKTPTVDVPIETASTNSEHLSFSANREATTEALNNSELITEKEVRRATRVLTKILNSSFSFNVSLSDSE